jgi:hypothetical protein
MATKTAPRSIGQDPIELLRQETRFMADDLAENNEIHSDPEAEGDVDDMRALTQLLEAITQGELATYLDRLLTEANATPGLFAAKQAVRTLTEARA